MSSFHFVVMLWDRVHNTTPELYVRIVSEDSQTQTKVTSETTDTHGHFGVVEDERITLLELYYVTKMFEVPTFAQP